MYLFATEKKAVIEKGHDTQKDAELVPGKSRSARKRNNRNYTIEQKNKSYRPYIFYTFY